ncbi:hypothetical protein RE476_05570 [Methanolobus mangrovi]|uniref:EfeO-type cupredoxin-like domain-containing protein n=1 Tax=Methanolobus mangrovi TaxID=3072977 RepID=A0AA51UHI4_9EURY|nr:hypothetical protein [Methanolobus mangrovi]WMW23295.1 hypothetical protein RE476_05570 [Methanolobus mangrovi]
MRARSLLFLIVLVSVLTLFFSGCVEEQSSDIPSNEDTSESQAIKADAIVYIDKYEFHPYSTTISSGDTVRWINNDSVAFIIKGNLVGGNSFQSPTLRKNDTFTYTFEDVGTYNYELVTHPWTNGGLIVVE